MRKFLTILFLMIGVAGYAIGPRTYYVSNAGNNANNGLTTATSWLTLAQVNATVLASGDSVLLKRGDVFYGTLTNAATGVTFADYGTGAKPIISGFVTIAGWTNLGSNLYEAVVPNGLTSLNMVISNGVTIPMGRYPNENTANGGYLTYENYRPATPAIVDNQLTNTPNWTNADIVVRKQDYVLVRNRVVNHTDSVITVNTAGTFDFRLSGYGYFFENDIKTLDQNGEWYYDSVATKIKMYYTTTPPTIQVATVKNLIDFTNSAGATKSNINIKNLSLQGSEGDLMYASYISNIVVDSVDFTYAGGSGFNHRNLSTFTLQNCTFTDINMVGYHESFIGNDVGVTVQNNKFKRIGWAKGMIVRNNPNYPEGVSNSAIVTGCANMTIKGNTIDSIGYCGILLGRSFNNQIVRQNVISTYCTLKNDGGSIYSSGIRNDPMITVPVIIDSNIVFNSGDASNGTNIPNDPHTRGIYLDASSSKVNIYSNTIYNSYEGIYISQAQNINIKYNTIYGAGKFDPLNNKYSGSLTMMDGNDGYQHLRNNVITNNIFFADNENKLFLYQTDRYNGVDSVGVIDSNKYVHPMDDFPFMQTNTTVSSTLSNYSLRSWKDKYPVYDPNSTYVSPAIAPFSRTFTSANFSPNSTFTGNTTSTLTSGSNQTLSYDNNSAITGAGSAKIVNTATGTGQTQLYQIFGAIDATKKYIVRFKTRSTKFGIVESYFQEYTGAYAIMTATKQYSFVDTSIKQHELLISGHTTISSGALYLNFSQSSQTIYVDDIEVYEATSTPNVMTDYVKFSVNTTASPLTVSLGGNYYTTLNNTSINTSTIVPPYSSSILFKGAVYIAPVLNKIPVKLPFKFKRN